MARKTIDQQTRKKILRYLKSHSQGETARKFDISTSTVNAISKEPATGKPFAERSVNRSEPKKATAAHVGYAKERRRLLLDKFLGRVDGFLEDPDLKVGQMQGLAIAIGTIIDKCRLEEGTTGEGKAALLVLANKIQQSVEEQEQSKDVRVAAR